MSLEEVYDVLYKELSNDLTGVLVFDGVTIKWEFDSFSVLGTDEDAMHDTYEMDYELIIGVVDLNDFSVSQPEIVDQFIMFYITE